VPIPIFIIRQERKRVTNTCIKEGDIKEGTLFRAVFEDMLMKSHRVAVHVSSYIFSIVIEIRCDLI
jgi:hypothetical protein